METRKHIKTYLAFLKHSQRFYREHVQKLNASYGPFPELQHIARPVNGGSQSSTADLGFSTHLANTYKQRPPVCKASSLPKYDTMPFYLVTKA